jgi:endonuclease IV
LSGLGTSGYDAGTAALIEPMREGISMPLFGAHMSVAGGYHNALIAARDHDCTALQLFTKNANQWAAKPLTDDDVRLFRRTLRQTQVKQTIAHDSYLIRRQARRDLPKASASLR